ncbi:hypothetical protein QWJ07_03970 [Frankia sp. RB7]|nr:hypothetical protein [Frankia sp. RB7]
MSGTYATVEEVTAYLTARGLNAAWDAAGGTKQNAALVEATSFLDAAFSWVGSIADSSQTLAWPRLCAYDREGRVLDGIPQQVKDACSELANLALGGRLMPMDLASNSATVKRDKIGDVEVEYDTTNQQSCYDYVRMILRGIGGLRTNSGMNRLLRV